MGQKVQVEIGEIDPRGKLSLHAVVEEAAEGAADAARGRSRGRRRRLTCRSTSRSWRPVTRAASSPPGRTAAPSCAAPSCPAGSRVLTERMPGPALRHRRGLGRGRARATSRDGHHGSTHFLEHLLFKGTARRTAMDIAEAFDAVGGEANAATGKEHTCYYARVLDEDLPMAVDVIADMVTSARIDAGELETERGVILEELAMNDDDPCDVAHEQFAAAVLGTHPLGRPIGGTPDTIRAVPRDAVWDHYREHYRPRDARGHRRRRRRPRRALRPGARGAAGRRVR